MAQVMVGCKLPAGLIMEIVEPAEGRRPSPIGKRVILKGANSLRTDSRKALQRFDYAITPVDKEFAEAWFKRHKDFEFVKKGLVFIAENIKQAEGMRDERRTDETLRTGLEPLDMSKKADGSTADPRLPGPGQMHGSPEADADALATKIVQRSAA